MCNYFLRGNNAKKKAMALLVSRHVAIKSIKENLKLFFSLLLEVSLGLVNQKPLLYLTTFNDRYID